MTTALVVMAKAPIPGLAKTRLIPALGAEGAAHLAHRLLQHSVHQALALHADYLELCVSPDTRHTAFDLVLANANGKLALTVQEEGDLGHRMHCVFERVLRGHAKVLLMGTDAPALTTDVVRRAEQALTDHEAVFVPAMDGGYALVGLTRPVPSLFYAMTWSTPHVMAHTRLRAQQARLTYKELAPVHDIDEPADLIHQPGDWQ